MTEDVLEHHNRIVHHQADGQHQCQQGQGIDGKAGQRHQAKASHQANGNGDERDDRGPHGTQKDKNHQCHQPDRLHDGLVHILHRTINKHRVVIGNIDGHTGRQISLEAGNHFTHASGEVQRIRGSLPDHASPYRRAAFEPHTTAFIGRALLHASHVADFHRKTVDILDNDVAELGRMDQVGLGCDAKLTLLRFDAPRWQFQVAAADGILGVLRCEFVSREFVRIQPDAHRVLAFAKNPHIGHPRHGLQPRLDDAVDQVINLQRVERVAGKRQPDHRERISLNLGDDRLVDGLRQAVAHPRSTVSHLGRRRVGIFFKPEPHADLSLFGATDRGDDIHSIDAGNGILQRFGDLRLNHLGRGPRIFHAHGNHRLINLGVFAHAQAVETDRADQHNQQRQHGRQHRAADRDFSELHGAVSVRFVPWGQAGLRPRERSAPPEGVTGAG